MGFLSKIRRFLFGESKAEIHHRKYEKARKEAREFRKEIARRKAVKARKELVKERKEIWREEWFLNLKGLDYYTVQEQWKGLYEEEDGEDLADELREWYERHGEVWGVF
jgi:hypothetical protein